MNNLPKNWWASKTIWASVLATVWPILMFLSKQFGFDLPAADTVAGALGDIGTVVLSVIAIYGRVTASAPIAKPSTPTGIASVIVAMIACLTLAGCLSPSQEAQVQSAIAANKIRVLNACMTDILPYADSLGADVLASLVPAAAQALATVRATCDPANIDKVSLSASTLAFMAAEKTVIGTNGAVQPATVAPAPITAGTMPASGS